MRAFSRKSALAFAALLTLFTMPAGAQARAGRAALVIGNSAYKASPLPNPANDALDIAALLRDSGFEVILRTDQDLAGMERSLAEFAALLKGKDSALFYYAGHGVQVDGENYLIPVKEDIQSTAQAKARSVSLGDLLDRVKASGAATALIFLDACRDNPFPGSSRSGTRGLAVVSAPAEVETCIAYATQPGSTAQDGTGRNGVFTAAMLKQLGQPGRSLSDLMTDVIAEVKAGTGGKQNPRVDNGLSKPFYFVDPAAAAARAQAALDKSRAELAGLDAQLADLQKRIAATGDAQARQKLEVEEQRQAALQKAKALEAQNLAAEATRQKALAETAARAEAERAAAQAASAKAQSDLSSLAAARRAELEKLAQAAASDNPDVLIDTVERLEAVLGEVDGQYAAALQKSLDAVNSGWDKQLASLTGGKPEIWETDAEFAARVAKEKADLEAKRQAELAGLRKNIEAQRTSQTAAMRRQYDDTLATLQTKVWTVAGSGATLEVGVFDRNARTWPFTVGSADPGIPMVPVTLTANLGSAPDPKAAILALDAAVKAGALAGEFDWGISREAPNKRYAIDIRAVRVRNLADGKVAAEARPNQRAAYFVSGKRSTPTSAVGELLVRGNPKDGNGEVYVNGTKVGTLPYSGSIAEGNYTIDVKWPEENALPFSTKITVAPGQRASILVADKLFIGVGKKGPAGGIVFYDKGSYSDGWRFLEAAPTDQSAGIRWYNGSYKDVKTDTAVGTGRANTEVIIATQGEGNYAAMLCKKLSLNGYSDWFLPSKDELNLMYKNLKKAGLGAFGGSWWWSSSQNGFSLAWGQSFSSGHQASGNDKNDAYAVRAVRAF